MLKICYIYIYIYIYIYLCICLYMYMYICIYIYLYIYIHIHTYIYSHTHTHTHIHIQAEELINVRLRAISPGRDCEKHGYGLLRQSMARTSPLSHSGSQTSRTPSSGRLQGSPLRGASPGDKLRSQSVRFDDVRPVTAAPLLVNSNRVAGRPKTAGARN